MGTRERFYHTDKIQGFQTLSFDDDNSNPVEIEIQDPMEYSVRKNEYMHSIHLVMDKEAFTQLAKAWLQLVE